MESKKKEGSKNEMASKNMMEVMFVPFLKFSSHVREIEENINKGHEHERERVNKNKDMLEMGDSQLFMPPQPQTHYQDNQPHRESQRRRTNYHEDQYQRQNLPHHDFQQQEQSQKDNQYREKSKENRTSASISEGYLLLGDGKIGRHTSSDIRDHYVLAGSAYRDETKLYLTSRERERVMKDLKEAQETDAFKMWPVHVDGLVPDRRAGEGKKTTVSMEESTILLPNCKGKPMAQADLKDNIEESAILKPTYQGPERQRRDDMKKEWNAKGERDIAGRSRTPGGYEDVLENDMLKSLGGFKSSLPGVNLKKYRRGHDTDEEDGGKKWRSIRQREKGELVAGWGGGFRQSMKDGLRKQESAGKAGSSKDGRAKYNSRSADNSDSSNGSSTRSKSHAEQKHRSNGKPAPLKSDAEIFPSATDDTCTKYRHRSSSHGSQVNVVAEQREERSEKSTSKDSTGSFCGAKNVDSERHKNSRKGAAAPSDSKQKQGSSNNKLRFGDASGSDNSANNNARPRHDPRTRSTPQEEGATRSNSQAEQEQKQESSDKPKTARRPTYTSSFAHRNRKSKGGPSDVAKP
ncbi:hypothetical protein WAI453_011921 [Rhynchosporium graminicola]